MLKLDGDSFVDAQGRTVQFRGINLGGSSKLPAGRSSHHAASGEDISFVGRPFPLAEADEHFTRLKQWGFNLIRFVVPWEAIEHAGRGVYDEAYLSYVRSLLERTADYGFYLYIDPHQDAWSRFSGGDGAPAWTLELAGFNLSALAETGAATLHAVHGNPFPHMIWGTNYGKLASATMFTLFWAGRDLAPKTTSKGVSLQTVLQDSYIAAFARLAKALQGVPNLLGYGVMNEPSSGFIGVEDLTAKAHSLLLRGPSPSVLQAMGLGAGLTQRVEVWELGWTGPRLKRLDDLNRRRRSSWDAGTLPIWQENGVWEIEHGEPKLLRPQHFSHVRGRKIHFYRDYYLPFARRYAAAIREHQAPSIFFVEGVPADPELYWSDSESSQAVSSQAASSKTTPSPIPIVHAPHWYDVATLITKRFLAWLSYDAQRSRLVAGPFIRRAFLRQLRAVKRVSTAQMNGAPTLIGEVGVPMNLNAKRAYRTGDYRAQTRALDRSLSVLERSRLSYCIWNYTADNSHEHGDGWNAEDFSLYCREAPFEAVPENLSQAHLYQGGRALAAFIRPYAPHVAGRVSKMQFNLQRKRFELCFHSQVSEVPTVIFLPDFHYARGYKTELSDGELRSQGKQHLHYYPKTLGEHRIVITAL